MSYTLENLSKIDTRYFSGDFTILIVMYVLDSFSEVIIYHLKMNARNELFKALCVLIIIVEKCGIDKDFNFFD